MSSELPDRFCRKDGEDRNKLFVKRSPFSSELVVYSLLFLSAIALVTFTVIRTRKRISDFKGRIKRRRIQDTIGWKTCKLSLPLRKEEFFALFLVCLSQFLLCIRLFVGLMSSIPQFADSLVTDKQKDDDLSGDFGSLKQWCKWEVAGMTLFVQITVMIQMMVFATRLLGIFNSGPQMLLRLPKRVTQSIYALLVGCTILVLGQTTAMLSTEYSCVKVWNPAEGSGEYFGCGMDIPQWLAIVGAVAVSMAIAFNIFILALYFDRFSKMLDSRRTAATEDDQIVERNKPILKAMEKLTVLGTTAILSSFVLWILFMAVLLVFGAAQYWIWAVDMLINNMCLLLVFKWMDDVYIALFWHRFCCVVSCVRTVMGVQLGLKKVALGSMLESGTQRPSMQRVVTATKLQKSGSFSVELETVEPIENASI